MSEHGAAQVSDLFDPAEWQVAPGAANYTDITAHLSLSLIHI